MASSSANQGGNVRGRDPDVVAAAVAAAAAAREAANAAVVARDAAREAANAAAVARDAVDVARDAVAVARDAAAATLISAEACLVASRAAVNAVSITVAMYVGDPLPAIVLPPNVDVAPIPPNIVDPVPPIVDDPIPPNVIEPEPHNVDEPLLDIPLPPHPMVDILIQPLVGAPLPPLPIVNVPLQEYPTIDGFIQYPLPLPENHINIKQLFRKTISLSDARRKLRLTGPNIRSFYQDVRLFLGIHRTMKYEVVLELVRNGQIVGRQSVWLKRKCRGCQMFLEWDALALEHNIDLDEMVGQEIYGWCNWLDFNPINHRLSNLEITISLPN